MTDETSLPAPSDAELALHNKLREAAAACDMTAVRQCMDAGADPNIVIDDKTVLEVAVRQRNNLDVVSYLIHHPKTDLNLRPVDDRTVWQTIFNTNYFNTNNDPNNLTEHWEYREELFACEKKLEMGNGAQACIAVLVRQRDPERLDTLLSKLERDGADMSDLKAGRFTSGQPVENMMTIATTYGTIECMHTLKDHGFAIDVPTTGRGAEAIPPIHNALSHSKGLEMFHLLKEWGADLHAIRSNGENILFAAVSNAPHKPKVALTVLREAFNDGVEICKRNPEAYVDPSCAYLLPSACFPREPTIIHMLIAGGLEAPEQAEMLEQCASHLEQDPMSYNHDVAAFAREVVSPYTKLPRKLPQKLEGITRADLERKNEADLNLLDHPNTWFRFRTLQVELAKNGEAFTMDELRAGRMHPSGMSFLEAVVSNRGVKEVHQYFGEQGDGIRTDDLVDAKGEPTDLLATIIDFGQLTELFSSEMWNGKTPHELKKVYAALDDGQQKQITNIHQLAVQLSRPTAQREVA